LLRTY
jgi:hypothetical protein